ncbi:MAG: 3-phosphoshikimate 1-carboxyvinyltransferase [Clostridium sp.]|nr:3-phosphoshikimate 1-carboxyvinyltransferase [Clostridium sp.]
MNYVKISPSVLKGTVSVPPSKSLSHRAIIAAGLSNGVSTIKNIMISKDITASLNCIKNLGAEISKTKVNDDIYNIKIAGSTNLKLENNNMDCFESGSTLRFFIPIFLVKDNNAVFKGKGKLVSRPLNEYYKIFDEQGIPYSTTSGNLPLNVKGPINPGNFKIKGNISSQFITGLLFALPLLSGDSNIEITTELESKSYIDLTLDVLKDFSINITNDSYSNFSIKGNQKYKNIDYEVEGDFSQAAFWLCAGGINGNIGCSHLNLNSIQGDREIIDIIKRMGINIVNENEIVYTKTSKTISTVIDASQCPDIIPPLCSLAALSSGTTEIINAKRLRIKESDRLEAMCTELNKLGADIKIKGDGLIIKGKSELLGGEVDSWNDHRIAMSLAIASLKCKNPVVIKNSSCITKSYPTFWKDFKMLGGKIDEWSLG